MVIDSHPLTRDSICDLIAQAARDLRVVSAASADDVAPDTVATINGALVVLYNGNDRPPCDARIAEDVERLRAAFPGAPIALLAPAGTVPADRMGLRGHIAPSLTPDVLVAALRLIMAGGSYFPPPENMPLTPPRGHALASLTQREGEVLTKLCQGKANKIIAYELAMSENTVKVHVYRIMKKLGAANRTEVVSMVQRMSN